MPSTRPYLPRICLVFDFDKTLASDSFDGLMPVLGIEREDWQSRWNEALGDGWDPILRRGTALIDAARGAGRPLTREAFREAAGNLDIFPGVLDMPERVRQAVAEVHEEAECEFVVLSSGFVEIIRETAVAEVFDPLWAGAFHFEDGEARAVKRVITHPQKALHLRAYAEGLNLTEANLPGRSDSAKPEHEMHVLYDQMIYVGDGFSDLQAFGFLEGQGGMALAIDDGERFGAEARQSAAQRAENLAPPDYRDGSELMESLLLAARAAAARVALRARGRGE